MLLGTAQNSERTEVLSQRRKKPGRQRKSSSMEVATTKTKAEMYDDDASGAEAGRLPSPTPKLLRWLEPKNASSASLPSLVHRCLPPDLVATGPYFPREPRIVV